MAQAPPGGAGITSPTGAIASKQSRPTSNPTSHFCCGGIYSDIHDCISISDLIHAIVFLLQAFTQLHPVLLSFDPLW